MKSTNKKILLTTASALALAMSLGSVAKADDINSAEVTTQATTGTTGGYNIIAGGSIIVPGAGGPAVTLDDAAPGNNILNMTAAGGNVTSADGPAVQIDANSTSITVGAVTLSAAVGDAIESSGDFSITTITFDAGAIVTGATSAIDLANTTSTATSVVIGDGATVTGSIVLTGAANDSLTANGTVTLPVIDGGGGVGDSLVTGASSVITIGGAVTNVEDTTLGAGGTLNVGQNLSGTVTGADGSTENLNLTNGTIAGAVDMGTGDDVITVTTGSFGAGVDGGAGTDTLTKTNVAVSTVAGVIDNIETIDVNVGTLDANGNITNATTITIADGATLQVDGGPTTVAATTLNVNGTLTTDATAVLNATTVNLDTETAHLNGATALGNTVTLAVTGDGSGDGGTIDSIVGDAGVQAITIGLDAATDTLNIGAVTAFGTAGADTITVNTGDVTFTGGITGGGGGTRVLTYGAAGNTVSFTTAGNMDITIAGSTGVDTLTMRPGAGAVDLAGGDDVMTVGAAGAFTANIDGGADDDTLNIAAGVAAEFDATVAAETINILAGGTLNVDATLTATTINGSTGVETITVEETSTMTATTISLGADDDVVTLTMDAVLDVDTDIGLTTIDGGAGDDTITFDTANRQLTFENVDFTNTENINIINSDGGTRTEFTNSVTFDAATEITMGNGVGADDGGDLRLSKTDMTGVNITYNAQTLGKLQFNADVTGLGAVAMNGGDVEVLANADPVITNDITGVGQFDIDAGASMTVGNEADLTAGGSPGDDIAIPAGASLTLGRGSTMTGFDDVDIDGTFTVQLEDGGLAQIASTGAENIDINNATINIQAVGNITDTATFNILVAGGAIQNFGGATINDLNSLLVQSNTTVVGVNLQTAFTIVTADTLVGGEQAGVAAEFENILTNQLFTDDDQLDDDIAAIRNTGSDNAQELASSFQQFSTSGTEIFAGNIGAAVIGAVNTAIDGRIASVTGVATSGDPYEEEGFVVENTAHHGAHEKTSYVWFKGLGGVADQGERDNIQGYNQLFLGGVVGIDTHFGNNKVAGFALGYTYSDVDYDINAGTETEVDTIHGTAYGRYDWSKWFMDGKLGFVFNDYDSKRVTPGGAIAKGDFDGHQVWTNIGGGYKFQTQKGVNITPRADLYLAYLDVEQFTETGAGAANLTQNFDSQFNVKVGAELAIDYPVVREAYTFIPELRVGVDVDVADAQSKSQANFGVGNPFDVEGPDPARFTFNAGVGLEYQRNNWSIEADYDFDAKEDYHSHTGQLKVKLRF